MKFLNYPAEQLEKKIPFFGIYPMDFILETVFEMGLEWFRTTPQAPNLVYGNLLRPILKDRYGQSKIDEIYEWVKTTDIRITQSWPTSAAQAPSISINLANAQEVEQHAALDDFAEQIDFLGEDNKVVGREEIGYAAIQEELLLGIHTVGTPDKTKYLHMLVIYLLNSYVDLLDEEGFFNMSFRATDLSRLNEYLPQGLFSRFVSISGETFARIPKNEVPIIGDFDVRVKLGE